MRLKFAKQIKFGVLSFAPKEDARNQNYEGKKQQLSNANYLQGPGLFWSDDYNRNKTTKEPL